MLPDGAALTVRTIDDIFEMLHNRTIFHALGADDLVLDRLSLFFIAWDNFMGTITDEHVSVADTAYRSPRTGLNWCGGDYGSICSAKDAGITS